MSFFPSLPPPPTPYSITANAGIQPHNDDNSNAGLATDTSASPSSTSSPSSFTPSIIIMSIVVSSAIIISASIYILLRFLSRRRSARDVIDISSFSSSSESSHIHTESALTALNSLPLLTFGSANGNLTGKDCSVCLSKFEKEDKLRLLPLCCHAFHSQCIDAWLLSNQTCPLCRSAVYPTDIDIMNKVLSVTENVENNINNNNININNNNNSSSSLIEIGSTFEYIVDDSYEIPLDSVQRRGITEITVVDDKDETVEAPAGVGGSGSGRNWLKEYVDRLTSMSMSSRSLSFRNSGRLFSGSSRRSDVVVPVNEDLELEEFNGRAGEDISEIFRWISGV